MKKIILAVFLIFIVANYRNLNLGFLTMYSIDEFAFYGSLMNMYEGLINFNIKGLFSFGFYSYGFLYFLVQLITTLPFFYLDTPELAIFATRMLTSAFACGSIYLIISTIPNTNRKTKYLIILITLSIPAFWRNAFWNHPDWMMTFFILAFINQLSKAEFAFSRKYWLAILMFSIAVSTKIQALIFSPILILYFFRCIKINPGEIKNHFKIIIRTGILIITVFLLTNPYIIHPDGLDAFVKSFLANMKSNANNHGSGEIVTITTKIKDIIFNYYFNVYSIVLISIAVIYLFLKRKSTFTLFTMVTLSALVALAYLLIFVNKDWQHYYLPVIILLVLPLSQIRLKNNKQTLTFFVLVLMAQLIGNLNAYHYIITKGHQPKIENNLEQNIKISEGIIRKLEPAIRTDDHILIAPYIPFEFNKLNLTYKNIHLIYGPLQEFMYNKKAHELMSVKKPFNPKRFIIILKKSIHLNPELYLNRADKEGYVHGVILIQKLDNPKKSGFKRFAETEDVIIWENVNI